MAAPIVQIFWNIPVINLGVERILLPYWGLILMAAGGFILLILNMHLVRAIGWLHGAICEVDAG